ncbi:MAG: hypothetical protein DPW18_20740 [Chloroflexi bacterium]|nr:hypothetical protein [Chloroflexota bacterium]MDL1942509.1 hypothetical protein [Chloroflexi bacterium CFX2]
MLQNLSNRFYHWARGWLVLVLLALDMFFAGFLMPLIGGLMQGGQGGIQPLDLMLFATPDEMFAMIEKYGEFGRPFYRNVELTVDIVYPIIYLFAFGLLISWLFQRGFSPNSPMMKLNVMPLGAWLFDLLENLNIVAMLSMYPSKPVAAAWLLFLFSTVKWLFAAASILLILVGLAMAIRNGFKKQA